jgi:hypothetical protein
MRYQGYFFIFLLLSSCNRQAAIHQEPVQAEDGEEHSRMVSYVANNFFSSNATSANIYADSIFAFEIDSIFKTTPTDGSTGGDMRQYYRAREKLDTMIESVYQGVYQKLKTDSDKRLLETTQREWRTYFAGETKFLHEVYYTNKDLYGLGKEHAITQSQWAFQVARQRLILLKNIEAQLN